MNPYFTKGHFLLVSIMFSIFMVACILATIISGNMYPLFFAIIFYFSYDLLTVIQIAQLGLKNEDMRKWFLIVILTGPLSFPVIYKRLM